ncbi:MAG: hypothetical protein A2Y15_09185 [Clostridiales bacterium GWF2_36_10]|nr:MAG: hypothetical protein A2Y15_09185 [Clostridiales bacterium GWF2_36_10]HAN21447.1 hypothetical protein [Clostridiales bacterium]
MDEVLFRLEKNRKAVMKCYLLNGLLLLISGLSFLPLRNTNAVFVPVLFFLATIIYYLSFTWKKQSAYVKSYKHDIVEAILKKSFTDLYFDPKNGLAQGTIKDTGMMMMGNRYHSDDYIRGKYKDINFEQSDVCIQQVTSNGKTTTTTTYFKGRWMIFEFNKNFAADMQVRESGFHYAKSNSGWFTAKEDRMEKLDLEDAEFNRDFDVYAANEHEAYYILTPHIMQSIKTLRDRTDGKLILCFVTSRLHVGVNNNKNAFEPPIFRALDAGVVSSINDEINVITRFVDELKLDRNLYKQNS